MQSWVLRGSLGNHGDEAGVVPDKQVQRPISDYSKIFVVLRLADHGEHELPSALGIQVRLYKLSGPPIDVKVVALRNPSTSAMPSSPQPLILEPLGG